MPHSIDALWCGSRSWHHLIGRGTPYCLLIVPPDIVFSNTIDIGRAKTLVHQKRRPFRLLIAMCVGNCVIVLKAWFMCLTAVDRWLVDYRLMLMEPPQVQHHRHQPQQRHQSSMHRHHHHLSLWHTCLLSTCMFGQSVLWCLQEKTSKHLSIVCLLAWSIMSPLMHFLYWTIDCLSASSDCT